MTNIQKDTHGHTYKLTRKQIADKHKKQKKKSKKLMEIQHILFFLFHSISKFPVQSLASLLRLRLSLMTYEPLETQKNKKLLFRNKLAPPSPLVTPAIENSAMPLTAQSSYAKFFFCLFFLFIQPLLLLYSAFNMSTHLASWHVKYK